MILRRRLFVVTVLLLAIAASRLFRLDVTATELRVDEFWSIWQTFGTPADILRWTPYDWTPLYYLTLGFWHSVAGLHPIVLRLLSVFVFLIGAAALYRAVLHWRDDRAAMLVTLAYAALGYTLFLSTELRGYAFLLGLYPLALWLALRYFEKPRVGRAVALALALAAMVYVSLTSVTALLMLGVFLLLVYRRRALRGWLPALIALGLVLPEALRKLDLAVGRVDALESQTLPPLVEALAALYRDYAGIGFVVWVALFALASAAMLLGRRERLTFGLLLWVLTPVALYALNPVIGLFGARYAWWVTLGLALWVGLGLAYLPRVGQFVTGGILAALMLLPLPLDDYQIAGAPLGQTFRWLTQNARWGDVIVLDPDCDCVEPDALDYLTRAYFPRGFPYVTDPTGYRRVWYISDTEERDPDTLAAVARSRRESIFFGPSYALFRLYEAPPDVQGIPFENGMRFHGVETPDLPGPLVLHEGETFRVRLWWSVDAPPDRDYSVGLHVYREGVLIAQDDSAPRVVDLPPETSQWQTGHYYVEDRSITLPYPTSRGDYALALVVYFWQDGERVSAPDATTDNVLPLATLQVKAW